MFFLTLSIIEIEIENLLYRSAFKRELILLKYVKKSLYTLLTNEY